jgi:hypothetical protein
MCIHSFKNPHREVDFNHAALDGNSAAAEIATPRTITAGQPIPAKVPEKQQLKYVRDKKKKKGRKT